MAKDLTKEHYFCEGDTTTVQEIHDLAYNLLKTNWTMDIYPGEEARVINLFFDYGWRFAFSSQKRGAGLCSYSKKKVYISKWLLEQNLDQAFEFENTLRHELAHAMDSALGKRSNHGPHWVAIAKHMLCTGDRCYNSDIIQIKAITKYTVVCETCGYEGTRHKAPKKNTNIACAKCCNEYNGGKYTPEYNFRIIQNY